MRSCDQKEEKLVEKKTILLKFKPIFLSKYVFYYKSKIKQSFFLLLSLK